MLEGKFNGRPVSVLMLKYLECWNDCHGTAYYWLVGRSEAVIRLHRTVGEFEEHQLGADDCLGF